MTRLLMSKKKSLRSVSKKRIAPSRTDSIAKKTSRKSTSALKFVTSKNKPVAELSKRFPIVGIGASAGGLEAFAQLLRHLPVKTGMAFVLVQHLDPTHESILPELLARTTSMPVNAVKDGMGVIPNHIYVIPRNTNMAISQGSLRLLPRQNAALPHRSIDYFFQSLAEDQNNQAIGVILSGTASDGTLGLEEIKAEGGLTFAQDEKSAKYDSMPRNAIAAGCVDFVLPPESIAKELGRISQHPYVAPLQAVGLLPSTQMEETGEWNKILTLMRKIVGVDFTAYKQNTLQRRIARRLVLSKQETMADYYDYLRNHSEEQQALFQDFLIGVTGFFRRPEAFEHFKKKILPRMIKGRPPGEPLRVWVPACSSGQEAYSIAMAFLEFAEEKHLASRLQIFATDLNETALDKARIAFYPKSELHEVSPQRLRRFFIEIPGGQQINKTVREMCVFARQNMISDPPFSRLDLISCRNFLIYVNSTVQEKLMPLFHYALRPGGVLWLGASESVGSSSDLFTVLDRHSKFYCKEPALSHPQFNVNVSHTPGPVAFDKERLNIRGQSELEAQKAADRVLLARYAPVGVMINANMDILQFRGNTGPYLELAPGKTTLNLMKMIRGPLLLLLREALLKAKKEEGPVSSETVEIKDGNVSRKVYLEVISLRDSIDQERYFLVLFKTVEEPDPEKNVSDKIIGRLLPQKRLKGKFARSAKALGGKDPSVQIVRLQNELASTKEYLQSVIDQQAATNEELQSASEEIQSSNEELQSINEELETSKEELQAGNEELTTVNEELNSRNREISQLNNDLTNLFNSVDLPIVMVGSDLQIRRFTAAAAKDLNLSAADTGRSLTAIRSLVELPRLEELVAGVISGRGPNEHVVVDQHGRWISLCVHPYITVDNKIDGAVISLIDVNTIKRSEQQMKEAWQYAEAIVETVREPLLVLDQDLRIQRANRAFYRTFRTTVAQTEKQRLYELGEGQWDIPELRVPLGNILPHNAVLEDLEVNPEFKGIGVRKILINAGQLVNEGNGRKLILLAMEDITEKKRSEQEHADLLARQQAAEAANRAKDEFLAMLSHELRTPLNAMLGWVTMLREGQLTEKDAVRGLEIIERNTRSQSQLVEDLLDISRITTGQLQLKMGPVNLPAVIETALQSLKGTADSKEIRLEVFLDSKLQFISGDRQRLDQVVSNLVANAIKFTPNGGWVRVRLVDVDDSHAEITVSDSGQGISPGFQPYVFDRFSQADTSITRRHGGLGLGLAIAQHVVMLHGGTIRADSPGEGQGTTFTVRLPLASLRSEASALPHPVPRNRASAQLPPQSRYLKGVRVLIVDDEADSREVLALLLERSEAETKSAASVAEALDILAAWKPAILITDLAMPGQDGFDLIRKVRALDHSEKRAIPAIALTAYAREEDRQRALSAGFQCHAAKPVDPDELISTIVGLVKRRSKSPKQAQC